MVSPHPCCKEGLLNLSVIATTTGWSRRWRREGKTETNYWLPDTSSPLSVDDHEHDSVGNNIPGRRPVCPPLLRWKSWPHILYNIYIYIYHKRMPQKKLSLLCSILWWHRPHIFSGEGICSPFPLQQQQQWHYHYQQRSAALSAWRSNIYRRLQLLCRKFHQANQESIDQAHHVTVNIVNSRSSSSSSSEWWWQQQPTSQPPDWA